VISEVSHTELVKYSPKNICLVMMHGQKNIKLLLHVSTHSSQSFIDCILSSTIKIRYINSFIHLFY